MIFRKNKPEELATEQEDASAASAQAAAPAAPVAGSSTLTADVVMEGNLVTSGDLLVDGTVHGAVQAARCTIEENGTVQGYVVAEEVLVRGRVLGPICGVRVHIVAGGHVEGDVINTSLVVEDGAYLDGQIRRSEDPLGEWQQMWYDEEGEAEETTTSDEDASGADTRQEERKEPASPSYLRPQRDENGEGRDSGKEKKAAAAKGEKESS